MIAIDAGVLIATWDGVDAHHDTARAMLLAHDACVIHPINLGEALVHAVRRDREHWAHEQLDGLGVRQLELPHDHAFQLARVRAATGLRMPDVCALVTAEIHEVSLATFDRRLAAAARSRGVVALDS